MIENWIGKKRLSHLYIDICELKAKKKSNDNQQIRVFILTRVSFIHSFNQSINQ